MQRLDDWPTLLADAIKAASGRPFSWGEHDCALFAADVCLAITGHDPLAHVRGAYSSAFGAALTLRRLGCNDVAELADQVIGPRERIEAAQRGDWVLSPDDEARALGVCLGPRSAFLAPVGMTTRLTLDCSACWKIG